MASGFFVIRKGLNLGSQASDPSGGADGDFYFNTTSGSVRAYFSGAWHSAVFDDAAQTLTNKTISANDNAILDIPATDIVTLPSGNLSADNVQDALDELQSDVDSRALATDLTAHTTDTSGAHAASAISNVPAGNLAATDVQAALDELQTDVDTRATAAALTAHTGAVSGAHAASAISNTPSGNLAASDVQSALNELQTDVDTRATAAALTSHTGASSGVHGVTGNVVGTSDAQTLTNKTISGAANTLSNIPNSATTATSANTASAIVARDASGNVAVNKVTVTTGGAGGIDVSGTGDVYIAPSLAAFKQIILGSGSTNSLNLNGASLTTDSFSDLTLSPPSGRKAVIATAGGANIELTPNGTGVVDIDNLSLSDNTITTQSGDLNLAAASGSKVVVATASNANIELTPNGTGVVDIDNLSLSDNTITTQANDLILSAASGSAVTIGAGKLGLPAASADPTGTAEGQIYYNTTSDVLKTYDGAVWNVISGAGGGGSFDPEAISQAYCFTDGTGTEVNCSAPTVVSGKTRVTLSFSYTVSVNAGESAGHLEVYLNGQRIPRFIDSTLTPDAYYKEISSTVIELDSDYSALNYSLEVRKALVVADTSSTNATRISQLEQDSARVYNKISNFGAETDTSGWATYADAAATPVDGTGGTATATFTRSTTSPIRGTASFLYTPGALGNGASYDFTIDSADKARVLSIRADYVLSGTIADGDYQIWILDVTNNTLIQPAGYKLSGSSGTTYQLSATFQTASNSTSYRLIVHQAVATSVTLKLDSIYVGPQSTAQGAAIGDWQTYTPTGSWTTNTTYTGKWRRVGDLMECQVNIALSGAPGGAAALTDVFLPSGYTIDTAKLVNSTTSLQRVGYGTAIIVNTYPLAVVYLSTTSVRPLAYDYSGDGSATDVVCKGVAATSPSTFGSGNSLNLSFAVPIVGWGSQTVMSSETDTRIVDFSGAKASTQAVTANTTDVTFTSVKDSHASWSGSVYTVPVPGDYVIGATLADSSTNTWNCFVYKNGTSTGRILLASVNGNYGSGHLLMPDLKAGDTISLRIGSSITVAGSGGQSLSIHRLSGPATIAATESIQARYTSTSTLALSGTDQVVDYSTKDFDSHGAVTTGSSWKFTAPVSGTYSVHAKIRTNTTPTTLGLSIFKNGSIYSYTATGGVSALVLPDEVRLLAGEYIDVRVSIAGTASLNGAANNNSVSIKRVGNY